MEAFQTIMSLIGSFSGLIMIASFVFIVFLGIPSLWAKTILIANQFKSKINKKSQSFYKMVTKHQNNDELVPITVESDCDDCVNNSLYYNYYYKNSAPAVQNHSANLIQFSNSFAQDSFAEPCANYLKNNYSYDKLLCPQFIQHRKEGVYACEPNTCHASALRA